MKITWRLQQIVSLILFLLSIHTFAQVTLYSLDKRRRFMTKEQILEVVENRKAQGFRGRDDMEWRGTIYHKEQRKDTVINHVRFRPARIESDEEVAILPYEQQALWSYLDKQLPEFSITDYTGATMTHEDFLGKPTLINVWGVFCKPCIKEIPVLNALRERYKDQVNFVTITGDNRDKLVQFFEKKTFNYTHLIGNEAMTYYRQTLGINAVPKNLFIDAKGMLRYIENNVPMIRLPGAEKSKFMPERFEKILEKLLAENN